MLECQCKQEDHLCDVCCKDGADGECKPTADIPNMKDKGLKQFPGAPCDDFNGYCDVFLKCRAVDADGPLSRLKNKFFSKEAILGYIEWIKEYWWAVALMGVGLILLMAGKGTDKNKYNLVIVWPLPPPPPPTTTTGDLFGRKDNFINTRYMYFHQLAKTTITTFNSYCFYVDSM